MSVLDANEQSKKIQEIRNKEEEAFLERVSKKFNVSYIDLTGTTIETDALGILTEGESRNAQMALFKKVGKDLHVAVKSPNLPETKKVLDRLKKDYALGIYMASTRSLEKAWERYNDIANSQNVQGGMLDISEEKIKRFVEVIKTNEDIAREFNTILNSESKKKTSQLMEVVFGGAIATGSSDIHIEAQEEQVRIRFRQDGVLYDIVNFDYVTYGKMLSRIKLLSEMKLTQSDNAQDGRFTIDFNEKEIEVRVSVIPSAYGESFVMRILNPDGIRVGVENLGIEKRLFEILLKEIEKPNGMILTTGPTGSGKTTTLYSFLRKVYTPEKKIMTIEDPIEYHLEGISQTQTNHERGYDFLAGLRAALRQDPDIVMVGEIRDNETATIAVNASLTGHLVLSTLHTNSAAGVIPRLLDLGVSPQILAAALSVSLAQRLVRKVCQHCKYDIEPTEEQETLIRNILKRAVENEKPIEEYGLSVDQKITLAEGRGCDECNGTGYKGRIGLFEAIITDELIEELLNKKPSEQEVRRVAEKQGLLNMREDGVIKILNGLTSFEEVKSVVDLDISNITKINSDKPSESQQEKKQILKNEEKASVVDTSEMKPDSLLNERSIEISLLLDYLKRLEYEQMVNPEIDASEKISQVQATILDLISRKQEKQIIKEDSQTRFKRFSDDLQKLYEEQQQNPSVDISHKIKAIRQEMETHA